MVRLNPFSFGFGTEIRLLCSLGTYNTPVKVTAPCTQEKVIDKIEAAVSQTADSRLLSCESMPRV